MKERKGPFGLMVGGIVDSVVQTARRRAQDREPRALIYDASGRPRLLKPGEAGRDDLVATGGRLIELVGGVAVPAEADGGEPDADDVAAAEAETQADAEADGAGEQSGENPA